MKQKNVETIPSKAKAQYAYYNLNTFDATKAKNEGTIIGMFCAGFVFLGVSNFLLEFRNLYFSCPKCIHLKHYKATDINIFKAVNTENNNKYLFIYFSIKSCL